MKLVTLVRSIHVCQCVFKVQSMNLDQAEKFGNICVSIVTILAILFGGIFGLIEYFDYKKSNRIENSLVLVERFNQGEILKNRAATSLVWQDLHQELINLFQKDSSPEAYEGFVLAVVKEKNLAKEVSSIMGFYEETAICVNAGLCETRTINRYFSKSGRSFFNKYYPYVCNQRTKWNDSSIWKNVQINYNPESIGKICN